MIKLKNILLELTDKEKEAAEAIKAGLDAIRSNQKKIDAVSHHIFQARDSSWGESWAKKNFGNDRTGIRSLALAVYSLYHYDNVDINIIKTIISIILRESKASSAMVNIGPSGQEFLGWVHNMVGGNHSQGYAQIQPDLVKRYNLPEDTLETMSGAVNGLYKLITSHYNKAVSKGYKGSKVTIWDKDSKKFREVEAVLGDAALHIAIAAHNGGSGIIQQWCKTNKLGLAAPCGSTNYKNDGRISTGEKIKNYVPRMQSSRGDTVQYMNQVYNSFDNLEGIEGALTKGLFHVAKPPAAQLNLSPAQIDHMNKKMKIYTPGVSSMNTPGTV